MERAAELDLVAWRASSSSSCTKRRVKYFVAALSTCAVFSAALASWAPLGFSIVTVFLFAGPHNWFELRYFLMRLPARFGKSRNFFLVAFTGIGALTLSYLSIPVFYYVGLWSGNNWITVSGAWNTALVLWSRDTSDYRNADPACGTLSATFN